MDNLPLLSDLGLFCEVVRRPSFAVAASDYSAQGWAIGEAVADTERLRAHFVARHGAPKKTWLVGWSMGGLVALASAERHPRAWDGVVAMCGVTVPTEPRVRGPTALARTTAK